MNSRMKKANYEHYTGGYKGQDPFLHREYEKMKHADEFINHLSEDMKKTYEDYIKKMKKEKEEFEKDYKRNVATIQTENSTVSALICLGFIVLLFELIHEFVIHEEEPQKDKKDSK